MSEASSIPFEEENILNSESDTSESIDKKNKITEGKKILFIDIDDEVTAVYERIKSVKAKNIFIVVPKRASLFNSMINLKILKKKLEDENKTLNIITNDKTGIQLALQSSISVYEKSEEDLPLKEEKINPGLKISPLKATQNLFDDPKPIRLEQKKFSLFDIIKKKKQITPSKESSFRAKLKFLKKQKNIQKGYFSWSLWRGYRGTFSVLIGFSILLLFFVSYIALPGSTIYLKAKSDVIVQQVNIVFADYQKNAVELSTHPPNVIAAFPIIPDGPIEKSFPYNATGKIFRGENASAEISIVNQGKNPWTLVKDTRFQTPDGIIFRLKSRVNVPPASSSGPGILKALVVADQTDINGNIVGDRGNIAPTNFFLPALRAESRKILYGYNEKPITGGKTVVTKVITKEDLEAAKEYAKKRIIEEIEPTLKDYVDKVNKIKKMNLSLITEQKIEWERAIQYDDPQIVLDQKLVGKEQDSFEIKAIVKAKGMSFNYDEFMNILKRELKHQLLPQKKLINIDLPSITYRLFEYDPENQKYKVTASIKGIQEYELDPNNENGKRMIKKIKSHILGWNKEEAEKFIQNLDEIERVEIKTWPVWSPTMPSLESNIKIVIVKE